MHHYPLLIFRLNIPLSTDLFRNAKKALAHTERGSKKKKKKTPATFIFDRGRFKFYSPFTQQDSLPCTKST